MLVTTCPDCKTTFRISVGILEKAGGQVRCGRCASVFDANADLREVDDPVTTTQVSTEFTYELTAQTDTATEPEFPAVFSPEPEVAMSLEPRSELAADFALEQESRAAAEYELPNEWQPERGPEAYPDPEAEPERPAAELTEPAEDAAADSGPFWFLPVEEPKRHERAWAAGAIGLALLLGGQIVHQLRNELAGVSGIGPALSAIYSGIGADISPEVDLGQYELIDLTAVAEPSGQDQGWLIIETRVRNQGPEVQPVPHIFVRLLDRWEDTIAGRYFRPEEYAVTDVGDPERMNVGRTVDAQFIIVDPGPSATGFELEICVEHANRYKCESDFVFE